VEHRDLLGSCMGFGIRSSLQFDTLRTGGGPPLLIDRWSGSEPDGEQLVMWRERAGNPFHGRLLRHGDGYAFWASDAGWYVVDPVVPSIALEGKTPSLIAELRMFGVPASLCAAAAGDVALHASAVEIDGTAVLFAGPSMQGKTTIAAALTARGHRLLAEDTVRCVAGPTPALYPGPAVVRLRADMAPGLTLPHSVARPMANGRVALILDSDRRGDGRPVPLSCIILLRPGDGLSLNPVRRPFAARDVFALAFRLPLAEARAAAFSRIVDIVARVDVLDLHRPLTLESMDDVMDAVEAIARG
jgi:hypothetical protein